MPVLIRRGLCGSLAAVGLFFLQACAAPQTAPARHAFITRTVEGVVHIVAPDLAGLAEAAAYAHAQRHACATADALLSARGERSLYLGATAGAWLGRRRVANEVLDTFVAAHMDDSALAAAWAREASAEARALLQGQVDGYNRYLREHAADLPAHCQGQAWVRTVTIAEWRRLIELFMVQDGVATLAEAVLAAAPPAVVRPPVAAMAALAALDEPAQQLVGSVGHPESPAVDPVAYAWAFGAAVTHDGRGLLLADTSLVRALGSASVLPVHLTVAGQFDVLGLSNGVWPWVQTGFNRDLAWSHTVSEAPRHTLFALTLTPVDPTRYVVEDEAGVISAEAMSERRVDIQAREADGRLTVHRHTVWRSRHGLVLTLPQQGLAWTHRQAWAVRDANAGNVRALDTWLALARARRSDEARDALARLGLPALHTLVADRSGQTLYADAGAVPDVSAQRLRRCALPLPSSRLDDTRLPAAADPALGGTNHGLAGLGTARPVLLDGTRRDCDWARTNPAMDAPGLIPIGRLPVLQRRDFVQNSGGSYWLANPAIAPAGVSPLMGAPRTPQSLSTRASLHAIEAVLALDPAHPTDLRRVGLADVRALVDMRPSFAARLVLDDLLADCAEVNADSGAAIGPGTMPELSPLRQACGLLQGWDRREVPGSAAAQLFDAWWQQVNTLADPWRLPFNPEDAVATPAGLRLDDPVLRRRVRAALIAAWQATRSSGARAALGSAAGSSSLGTGGWPVDRWVQLVGFDDRGPVGWVRQAPSAASSSAPAAWVALPFHAEDVARASRSPALTLPLLPAPP
ncbi:MAG: hypothetical protein RIQ60_3060 [Pseudomonadota bacterium]|jgi:acyl-homoserine-lactone acylase